MIGARCALGLLVAATAGAQSFRAGVDPRIELLSIVFRLAGNPEYTRGRVPSYNTAIDQHFGGMRDHDAVRMARDLRARQGVAYDAVMSLAIHITDVETVGERVPFDTPAIALDSRWRGVQARPFLSALRRFVLDSGFQDFLASQAELYTTVDDRLNALTGRINLGWFTDFYGEPPGAPFVVVPGLGNGGDSYGVRFVDPGVSEELYAILGVMRVDADSIPVFDPGLVSTLVHEFSHSFVNPAMETVMSSLSAPAARMLSLVRQQMAAQAYNTPGTLVNESVVRAASARYSRQEQGDAAGRLAVWYEQSRYFYWTDELYELLGEYEQNREQYPTFRSFLPRLVSWFEDVAPRVEDVIAAYDARRPQVLDVRPANGEQDVDPETTEIVVRFDRPMRPGYSVIILPSGEFPSLVRVGFDETRTAFTMVVRLQAGRTYAFGLNSATGGNFLSEDGAALLPVAVVFKTR